MTPTLHNAFTAILTGALASDQESERLDFKEDARTTKEGFKVLLDAALCLANTSGGWVVLGVDDDARGQSAFVGSGLDPVAARKYIHDNSRPRLLVECAEESFSGARLIVVTVHSDQEIYADTRGRAPYRIGTDCVGMDPTTQKHLRETRQGFDPSGVAASDSAVDAAALQVARRRLLASLVPERNGLAKLSDPDLMRALGLLMPDGQLNAAGQHLLGPHGVELVYQYRESPGGEPRVVERLLAPLLLVYEKAIDLVSLRQQTTPLTLPDGQQLQIQDFPELAVREAIANALIHRDYRAAGAIVIEHSPQVFIVNSPGPLVPGVTIENILTHPSKPRNRVLAAAVRSLELAEEVGRGVDRMYREMVRSGRPTPNIEASFDHVRVSLVGGAPDLNIARYVAQLDPGTRDDTDAMIILLALCARKTTTAGVMAPLLQKGVDEAESSLRHVAADHVGMLEPTRQSARAAHPTYRLRENVVKQLGSAVPYVRHTSDDIDRRVIAHVREYARITNSTVQNLFTVSMPRARQILASLVEREILTKTSQAQRGPSVEYGPGPKFPPKPRRRRRGSANRSASDDAP